MFNLRDYHIMLNHSWDYNADYEIIKSWLDSAKNLNGRNYSVPLSKPLDTRNKKRIKREIAYNNFFVQYCSFCF